MLKGTTKSGFEFEISDEALNDMELIDALADVTSGRDTLQVSFAVRKLFGDEQRKRLYDHVRTESGNVPMDKIWEMIDEIMASSEEGKK